MFFQIVYHAAVEGQSATMAPYGSTLQAMPALEYVQMNWTTPRKFVFILS
jgi:hypothetical protein